MNCTTFFAPVSELIGWMLNEGFSFYPFPLCRVRISFWMRRISTPTHEVELIIDYEADTVVQKHLLHNSSLRLSFPSSDTFPLVRDHAFGILTETDHLVPQNKRLRVLASSLRVKPLHAILMKRIEYLDSKHIDLNEQTASVIMNSATASFLNSGGKTGREDVARSRPVPLRHEEVLEVGGPEYPVPVSPDVTQISFNDEFANGGESIL